MWCQSAEYYNVVDPVQLELWIPTLGFHNTEAKQSTVSDANSSINIIKEGNFTLSALSSLENAEEFRGGENKINLTRTYDINFICKYRLFWYPFDTQVGGMLNIQTTSCPLIKIVKVQVDMLHHQ